MAIFGIGIYRSTLGKTVTPCCRFLPSCSEYSRQAYLQKDFFVATYLAWKRILRCHPLGGSGFDPLPRKLKEGTSKNG